MSTSSLSTRVTNQKTELQVFMPDATCVPIREPQIFPECDVS